IIAFTCLHIWAKNCQLAWLWEVDKIRLKAIQKDLDCQQRPTSPGFLSVNENIIKLLLPVSA
ncbi:MAG: hypothetical protein P1P89_17375, partial [Desulfobacterales bacterium]|nr:hypothetical protein [Desulfobacterales bacterium]